MACVDSQPVGLSGRRRGPGSGRFFLVFVADRNVVVGVDGMGREDRVHSVEVSLMSYSPQSMHLPFSRMLPLPSIIFVP